MLPKPLTACPEGPLAILVVNPGSTSTKLALFEGEECVRSEDLEHAAADLSQFKDIAAQEEFRTALVTAFLDAGLSDAPPLSAVVGRGGLLRPLPGGTYLVNEEMVKELRRAAHGEHASNLGALIADRIARLAGCPAFIVDPVVVDELADEARLTGIPGIERRSIFHALSQKAAARRACRELDLEYESAHLVVAHLGGGISVGAHREGRVVEINNALDGEGPLAPERSGAVPARDLVDLCFDGDQTRREIRHLIAGGGGLVAHLGTNSLIKIEARLEEEGVRRVFSAFTYGIAKAITGSFAALRRLPQAIVLTGGGCRCRPLVDGIRNQVGFAAPILVYPENLEMSALAAGALRVLEDGETPRAY